MLQINRLLIGHNNEGMRAGWFLDSVQIVVPVHGKHYMFPSHRWLSKGEADGKTQVEIYPSEILDTEQRKHLRRHTVTELTSKIHTSVFSFHPPFPVINYEITVVTGDVMFAGTNAKVLIQIYGDKGKTEVIVLKSRSNNFERDTTEIFKVTKLF